MPQRSQLPRRPRLAAILLAALALAGCQESAPPADDGATDTPMDEAADAPMDDATDKPMNGAAFQAKNAQREGVVTLPSGLQYEVLVEGDGASPGATDRVVTHYHGTLIDGTVFDSSVERGEPASFAVDEVIAGWTEALQLMQVGDKWRLVIPPDLAYGKAGVGVRIGPDATLVFEVELLEVK